MGEVLGFNRSVQKYLVTVVIMLSNPLNVSNLTRVNGFIKMSATISSAGSYDGWKWWTVG